jgi:hypothetical protein
MYVYLYIFVYNAFSRVFSVIVAQSSEQNGLTFYVGIPKITILAPPLPPV